MPAPRVSESCRSGYCRRTVLEGGQEGSTWHSNLLHCAVSASSGDGYPAASFRREKRVSIESCRGRSSMNSLRADDVMSFDLATVVSSSAVAVISSWTVYRFTRRQSLDAESRTKNLAAASDLAQPLRDLQALMRRQGRVPRLE